ncbi:cytochrome c oxidase subunit 2A [Cytobacillus massiliigabonensis]|uniref:cytochrome c oxidase subunit 2A n=1 Tax=Cytobacillus massiliigabonensis TaxID=1871011 RepID=UPI000C856BC4|nr:cytochrome c oxidase subunit 2A [Cytobacillus massiliigabonensis]
MAKTELDSKKETKIEAEDSSSLKGTAASVAILGAFLVVSWVAVYFLFLSRF